MTNTDKTELEPCPFCGGVVEAEYFIEEFVVTCPTCEFEISTHDDGPDDPSIEGKKHWNTRPDQNLDNEGLTVSYFMGVADTKKDQKLIEVAAFEKAAEIVQGQNFEMLNNTRAADIRALIEPTAATALAERDRAKKVEGMREALSACRNAYDTAGAYDTFDLLEGLEVACDKLETLIAATEGESE